MFIRGLSSGARRRSLSLRAMPRSAAMAAVTLKTCAAAALVGLTACHTPGDGRRTEDRRGLGDVVVRPGDPIEPSRGPDRGLDAADAARRAADRAAIRSLAGVFDVRYTTLESLPLREGVAATPERRRDAREAVVLLDDTEQRMELLHLLLIGEPPVVLRHWRQVWTPAPDQVLRYVGSDARGRRYRNHAPEGEAPEGATTSTPRWSVTVHDADESPRFGFTGSWTHQTGGGSSFTSAGFTPRPLPRELLSAETASPAGEALLAETELTTSPASGGGWTRTTTGQRRRDDSPRAAYQAVDQFRRLAATSPAATDYLAVADPFWSAVREAWQARIAAAGPGGFTVRDRVDGRPLHEAVFAAARAAAAEPSDGRRDRVEAILDAYVIPDE